MLPPPPLQLLAGTGLSLQLPFSATSGAPLGWPRPSGCDGGKGGARRPEPAAGGQPEQVEGWWRRGCHGSASGARAPTLTSPLLACPGCLPAFSLCRGPCLTSLPSPSSWDLGAELSGVPGPMQCRLLRGLAGVLLTLLCMGLLSLRYHLRLSPKRVQDTPGLSPASPWPPELQLKDVFIAVKTTRNFHHSRLELLLDTWVSRTREQVTNWHLGPRSGPWPVGLTKAFLLGCCPWQPRGRSCLPTSQDWGAPLALAVPLAGPGAHCSSGPLFCLFQGPGWAPAPGLWIPSEGPFIPWPLRCRLPSCPPGLSPASGAEASEVLAGMCPGQAATSPGPG